MKTNSSSLRLGFTILETLIVISVLGFLLAITASAVQQTRSVARRIQCSNNLRQIVLAAHNYESVYGVFPTEFYPFRAMAPFLDSETNLESRVGLPVYLCPSDSLATLSEGVTSYLLNEGFAYQRNGKNGIRLPPIHDPVLRWINLRVRDVTDGLSNTAYLSERLISPFAPTQEMADAEPSRYLWYIQTPFVGPSQFSLFQSQCENNRTSVFPLNYNSAPALSSWLYGYNHSMPPNSVGCYNFSIPTGGGVSPLWDMGSIPATSAHSHGVNIALADGAVRFMANSVDLKVWQGISTRAGED